MQQELKDKFPSWVNDQEQGKFNLCLSNDIDSLIGCQVLSNLKGYKINHFYDFSALYTADIEDNRRAIGVDMALNSGRCFDNHVTKVSHNSEVNPLAANPNNLMNIHAGNRDAYTQKYALSTAIFIWSHYNLPLPQSEEAKMVLISLDGGHSGHFRFPDAHRFWLQQLGLEELGEVLGRHERSEFDSLFGKYNLHRPICIENGQLKTDINLSALSSLLNIDLAIDNKMLFKTIARFSNVYIDKHQYSNYISSGQVFSSAFTTMRGASCSLKRRKEDIDVQSSKLSIYAS